MKLEPGIYRLTRDVTNPKPDRRSKALVDQVVWEKGTRLHARPYSKHGPDTHWELKSLGHHDFSSFSGDVNATPHKDDDVSVRRWLALMEPGVLELEPDSLDNFLGPRGEYKLYYIVETLLDSGALTLAQLRAAEVLYEAKSDREEYERRERVKAECLAWAKERGLEPTPGREFIAKDLTPLMEQYPAPHAVWNILGALNGKDDNL